MSGWWLRWDTWHTPERSDRGCCSTGVVMLHSGQSSPGTPVRPGSIAGTGPADEKDCQCLPLHLIEDFCAAVWDLISHNLV